MSKNVFWRHFLKINIIKFDFLNLKNVKTYWFSTDYYSPFWCSSSWAIFDQFSHKLTKIMSRNHILTPFKNKYHQIWISEPKKCENILICSRQNPLWGQNSSFIAIFDHFEQKLCPNSYFDAEFQFHIIILVCWTKM